MVTNGGALATLVDELRRMPVHVSRTLGRSRKKQLLVLLLASKVAHGYQSRRFRLSDISEELSELILKFGGRQKSGNPHPEQPFFHLSTSPFWTCETTVPLTSRRRTPNPSQIAYGELSVSAHLVFVDPKGREQVVSELLSEWRERAQDELRRTLGL